MVKMDFIRRFRWYWLSIGVALVLVALTSVDTKAYTALTRVWPSSSTTYTKDTDFTSQGTGWVAAADGAIADWNSTGTFSFSTNTSSVNHFQAHSLGTGSCATVATTYSFSVPGQLYLEHFVIVVNTGAPCNKKFYDGTGTVPPNYYDLCSILRHELGHALGLGHTYAAGHLMTAGGISPQQIAQIDTDATNGAQYLYNPNYTGVFPDGPASSDYIVGSGYWDGIANNGSIGFVGYKGANWIPGTAQPRSYNTTLSWSNAYHSSAWMAFDGSTITRVYTKHYLRGDTQVLIDGVLQLTPNDYATLTRWQVAQTWSVSPGQHTIETRRATTDGKYSDLDAFVVNISAAGSGSYDDPNSQFKYIGNGTWTHSTCCATAYNGTISWSNTAQDAVTFTFTGTGITYVFTKAYNRGIAYITIDGGDVTPIDLYASPNQWQQSKFYGLSAGVHTIHIAVSGTKNPASADYYVDVDRMIVQP